LFALPDPDTVRAVGKGGTGMRKTGGRPLSTYSIVAADLGAGEIGVAVQSHWFSVGSVVPWAKAGVGAVATQALVNPAYGSGGLELLEAGRSPLEAVVELTAEDAGRELRQLAVIDRTGKAAAFTGSRCVPAAGHLVGDGFAVQANMMKGEEVWPAMAGAFEAAGGALPERLLAALRAAQAAGGDLRGQQSAALLVVALEPSGRVWEDRRLDLRVEDHPRPVEELTRLLGVSRAYEHMNRGDLALEVRDTERALAEYSAAEALCPDNLEMRFWHAVGLAGSGRGPEAVSMFAELFAADPAWRLMAGRTASVGLLSLQDPAVRRLVS
jgi:uncharacterized Ntn-hydrolase superfamily protein